jgi:hypothetical protein
MSADSQSNGGAGGGTPPGTILWARSASTAFLLSVAEGPTGVVVTGGISAPADLGGGLLAPQSGTDVVLAQYAKADGAFQFASRFGNSSPVGTGYIGASLEAFDTNGAPILTGLSTCDPAGIPACNQIDVGAGLMPGGGSNPDGFVGRYSVNTGAPTWVGRLSGPGNDQLGPVAPGPSGTMFLAGRYEQTAVLSAGGATQSFTAAGYWDALIAKFNPVTGAIASTFPISGPGGESISGMAWTGTNLAITGQFSESFNIGTKTLSVVSGDFDDYAALLDSNFNPRWAVSFPGPGHDYGPALVVDDNGDVYLAGTFSESITLGTNNFAAAGGTDIFVAKVSGNDGSVIWAHAIGSTGDDGANGIIRTPAGNLVVIGNVTGPTTANSTSIGGGDALLLSYSSDGALGWSKVIGTSGKDYGFAVARGSDALYAAVDLGASIGPSIEGVAIQGASNPTGLLLKVAY